MLCSQPQEQGSVPAEMPELEVFKTLWGVTEPLGELLPRLRSEGYAGVEVCLIYATESDKDILLAASQQGLTKLVVMLQTSGKSVADHVLSLDAQLSDAVQYRPVKINIHGGEDCWSFEQSCEYFTAFEALQHKYKDQLAHCPLLHETHRGRILYSPWASLPLLRAFPSLLLTADLSHWVVVGERHLHGFAEVMQIVAERTRHIHARPSSTQHIQLSGHELRSPAHAEDVAAFCGYWSSIFVAQASRGKEALGEVSVDPELGPFPYALLRTAAGAGAGAGAGAEARAPGQSEVDEDIAFVVNLVRGLFKDAAKGYC